MHPLPLRILLCLLLVSCARHPARDTLQDLSDVQRERDQIVAEFDPSTIERCDYITFSALLEAFTTKSAAVSTLEHPAGMWHRHFQPCFPGDSASETTRDGYIAVLHLAQSHQDKGIPSRMIDYAQPKGWTTSEGPIGITSIIDLVPMLYQMSGRAPLIEAPVIPSSTGHVLALEIYMHGRMTGALTTAEMAALGGLVADSPDDPMYLALRNRFESGDQLIAIQKLLAMPQVDAPFGWGSAPWQVYFATTTAILEGK